MKEVQPPAAWVEATEGELREGERKEGKGEGVAPLHRVGPAEART